MGALWKNNIWVPKSKYHNFWPMLYRMRILWEKWSCLLSHFSITFLMVLKKPLYKMSRTQRTIFWKTAMKNWRMSWIIRIPSKLWNSNLVHIWKVMKEEVWKWPQQTIDGQLSYCIKDHMTLDASIWGKVKISTSRTRPRSILKKLLIFKIRWLEERCLILILSKTSWQSLCRASIFLKSL